MAMTYLEILGWARKGVIAVLPFFFIWGVRGESPGIPHRAGACGHIQERR